MTHGRVRVSYLVASYDASLETEDIVDAARRILQLAHVVAGVPCAACHGNGYRAYGSTATWRRGIGGQAFTTDVCDECWGSGRSDVKHGDQRRLHALERAMRNNRP